MSHQRQRRGADVAPAYKLSWGLCIALSMTLLGCNACRSSAAPAPAQSSANAPALTSHTAAPLPQEELAALIALAQRSQDREFKQAPVLVASALETLEAKPLAWPNATIEAARVIGLMLWADDAAIKPFTPQRAQLARYDHDSKQLIYASRHTDRDALKRALVAALVDALRAEHFGVISPKCSTVDECLAGWIALQAQPQLGLAVLALDEQGGEPISAQRLSQRPELVRRLSSYNDPLVRWEQRADLASWAQAAAAREGFGFATALMRAQGYNALELLNASQPTTTTLIQQPARWFAGEGAGRWRWPEAAAVGLEQAGFRLEHESRLGATLTGMWFAQRPELQGLARQLPAALFDDGLQIWRRADQERALVWVAQWQTPELAKVAGDAMRQVAQDITQRDPQLQYESLQSGLKTVLVLSHKLPAKPALDVSAYLIDTRVLFPQREDVVPLRYSPVILDRMFMDHEAATLDPSHTFTSPALGLTMALDALAKQGWDVQLNRRPGVRWYARHQGSTAQLHADLIDPLGPAFEDKAYQDALVERIVKTLPQGQLKAIKPFKHPVGAGYELEITAQGRQMMIWHILSQDELLLTLSVDASESSFAAHSAQVVATLPTLKLTTARPAQDDGVLEFKVEP